MHGAPGQFACTDCSATFTRTYDLRSHRMKVHGDDESCSVCNICGKCYVTLAQLRRHLMSHERAQQVYECQECPKTFGNAKSLGRHKGHHRRECSGTMRGPGSCMKGAIRRPVAVGRYYSSSDAAWTAAKFQRQQVLSHVGRIEEMPDGTLAVPGCERCEAAGYECKVYTDDARKAHHTHSGHGCARCRYFMARCSLLQRATQSRRRGLRDARDNTTSEYTKVNVHGG